MFQDELRYSVSVYETERVIRCTLRQSSGTGPPPSEGVDQNATFNPAYHVRPIGL
jgi:hypothetical protein